MIIRKKKRNYEFDKISLANEICRRRLNTNRSFVRIYLSVWFLSPIKLDGTIKINRLFVRKSFANSLSDLNDLTIIYTIPN